MRSKKLAGLAATVLVALSMAACGDTKVENADDSTQVNAAAPSTGPAPTSGNSMIEGEFGPGCAAMPSDDTNPGSFAAMARKPVATAAAGNPVLSTLVTAVKRANLVDSLNNAEGVTVFAPTNDAFAKIAKANLDSLLADDANLTKVMTYHVVPKRLAPAQLIGTHKTLQGQRLKVSGNDDNFTVGTDSKIVCGNVQTSNATIYIVDTLLIPPY